MYYVMNCRGSTDLAEIPRLPGGPWMTGQPVQVPVPEPLRYSLDPDYPGEPLAMYTAAIPIFRDDLLDALKAAGVDNLQTFRVILTDTINGKELTNYKAVNIVGVVSCADMGASRLMPGSTPEMIDTDFDRLVIDEKKAGGALMFRLAEAVNAIVIHQKVKQIIESRAIPGMVFYGPGEWAG